MREGESTRREERIARALAERGVSGARVAIVLGSGLGGLAERVEGARTFRFEEIPGMPESRVAGHAGRFVAGRFAGVDVLLQAGRVHLYEGWDAGAVTASVRAFASLGVRALLLTNAAGAIRSEWPVPGLMRVVDHLNAQGVAPLRRSERARGSPYDPELGAALDAAATAEGISLRAGVYVATLGPSYETPAEIRHYAALGAAAVGMSTVAEASAAAAVGLRVAALSCLTNRAAGVASAPLSHEEVLAGSAALATDATRLVRAALPALAGA